MANRCSQGHDNPDNATFCDECGEPLPISAQGGAFGDEPTVIAPTQTSDANLDPTVRAVTPPDASDTEITQVDPDKASAGSLDPTVIAPATPPPMPPAGDLDPTVQTVQPIIPAPPPAMPVQQPVPAQPRLVVESSGATFDLAGKSTILVGREDAPSNSFPDWDLTPYGAEDGGVSRLHARLTQAGDSWTIEDLESTNFTFINRKRIAPKTPTPLSDGDEIRLGRVALHFKTTP